MTRPCGYADCTAPAVYAGRTTVPDAQTGKIRWHLTTQPDGEVVWREKE